MPGRYKWIFGPLITMYNIWICFVVLLVDINTIDWLMIGLTNFYYYFFTVIHTFVYLISSLLTCILINAIIQRVSKEEHNIPLCSTGNNNVHR